MNIKIKELEIQKNNIENEINKLYKLECLANFESHKNYINSCYKHKIERKYYKVVSIYSINDTRMTCLCFDLDTYPYQYEFKTIGQSKIDFPNIDIEMELFYLEDVFAFGSNRLNSFFDYVDKISEEEYNRAMNEKLENFKQQTSELPLKIKQMINKYKNHIFIDKED